jgi:hypothetical protein
MPIFTPLVMLQKKLEYLCPGYLNFLPKIILAAMMLPRSDTGLFLIFGVTGILEF